LNGKVPEADVGELNIPKKKKKEKKKKEKHNRVAGEAF
jgi:hypothetical protein